MVIPGAVIRAHLLTQTRSSPSGFPARLLNLAHEIPGPTPRHGITISWPPNSLFLISFPGHSGMGSLGGNSALASSFYQFWDLPQPPVCPWVRARVLPLPVSVSACPFAFVSNGQSLIGRAGSCLYPNDLLLSKSSTGWKRGWMCQKSSALLGRKGIWVDPRCRVLSDSQFVHQACGRWCNKPGPGQTTSCTFGGTDAGCGIWQFSQEETIWLILSKGRGRGEAGGSCWLYTPQVLQFRKEQSEIQGWFSKRQRLWTPFSKNTCLPKALFLSVLSEKQSLSCWTVANIPSRPTFS